MKNELYPARDMAIRDYLETKDSHLGENVALEPNFYGALLSIITNKACRMGVPLDQIPDVVGQTILNVLEKIHDGRFRAIDDTPVTPYVAEATKLCIYYFHRRDNVRNHREVYDPLNIASNELSKKTLRPTEDAVFEKLLIEDMQGVFKRLSLRQQNVMSLLAQGYLQDEIAELLHLNTREVRDTVYRAREKFREAEKNLF